ncbi:MAG: CehA/McbA family metallohydrolase [Chloroflexota bacterium]
MGIADLHAHTRHTAWGDGNQTVEELFRYVEEQTDVDLFAITDHDSTAAARTAWDIHRRGRYRFDFLPGVEVTNQAGHMLVYFPRGRVVDVPSLRPFWWTVRYAHRHGAICIPAHPVYPPWLASAIRRGLTEGARLDGLEAINAGISAGAQQRLTSVVARFRDEIALVGNSDAHDQGAIGSSYTRFPGRSIDDFLHALETRQTEPVFVRRPQMQRAARRFTTQRSMTRPAWVGNLWREVRGQREESAYSEQKT